MSDETTPTTRADELPGVNAQTEEIRNPAPAPAVSNLTPAYTGPRFIAKSVAANDFRIHEQGRPIGKSLTPTDAAVVMEWLKSLEA